MVRIAWNIYDMLAPIPERSGLPFPHASEHIWGQSITALVMFTPLLMAWLRKSSIEVLGMHVELDIKSSIGNE